jgi:hypothetical protein
MYFPPFILLVLVLGGCSLVQEQQQTDAPACPEPAACPACPAVECPAPQIIEKVKLVEVPAPVPVPEASHAGAKHLPIIGAVEWATLEPSGLTLEARIDSGAETTSVHAEDIQLIEKEGKRYVQFNLEDETGQEVAQELRLRRQVLIKQQTGEPDRRYVVRMWVSLGGQRSLIDVNLSDREDFEYPLLVGRNFLVDSFIVDVSRHHTQGR